MYREFYQTTFGLTDEKLLSKLEKISSHKNINEKEYLYRIGEPETTAWMLKSGICRGIVYRDDGKEITACLNAKQGLVLLSSTKISIHKKAEVDLQALTKCEFVGIPMKCLLELIAKHPRVMKLYMEQLNYYLDMHMGLEQIRVATVQERIRWFYERYGDVEKQVDDQYIASFLNMDRSTYCRKKKEMEI